MIEANSFIKTDLEALIHACEVWDSAVFLEMESSLNAFRDMKSIFLAREGELLIGALTIFAPSRREAEIGAAVLPEARRTGVFRALLVEAEREMACFGYKDELFVVDSRFEAGKAVAARLGAKQEFTEYALRYAGPCTFVNDQGLEIRRVDIDRLEELVDLHAEDSGDSRQETEDFERATFASPNRRVYAAFREGRMLAACSLGYQGRDVSINGLVVDKASRGKGYGQSLMARIIRILESEGYGIILDVESQNDNAYHIYKKLGFIQEKSVEYWRRTLPG